MAASEVRLMKGVEFNLRHAQRDGSGVTRLQGRLRFYSPAKVRDQLVFFIEQDGEVVALCNCEPSACGEVMTLVGMSVDPAHEGRGHCSQLVRAIGEFLRNAGYRALCVTRYTHAGLDRLRPCLLRHMRDIELLHDEVALAA